MSILILDYAQELKQAPSASAATSNRRGTTKKATGYGTLIGNYEKFEKRQSGMSPEVAAVSYSGSGNFLA